ncbi:acyl-phosphate glycerol 3-phosphate acyltransferase [Platysternon megacephalum]|uniref:Acyl-phosphate glycerol 3-phosphate acyltransferase n=1 Tax=Platysternon megacephalum TaxID=55544 RepID=A0A4D9DGV3_9SAUR|nr:acyl-phosphate glycerol 3-phosphate acyltransferase [Platysternon megacephalum]
MEAPVCLIETSPEGTLAVRPEALRVLEGVTQPVVVVAIAGLYRTGKSYLMNRLAGKNKGFSLGNTIQSHTKGDPMWCLPHPRRAGHTLVLLDTEGLGDMEKDNTRKDAWIFALAVLLSSALVYNSLGTIDGYALEKLHYVTELTKHIKVKAEKAGGGRADGEDAANFVQFFPDFVWAVRDFTLDLEADGRQITADEYLERGLSLESDSNEKATEAKKCIRHFFPSRKCFTFDRPASRRNLSRLEELQEDQLEPDFQDTARRFCNYVWDKARPMTILGGHQVTGTALGNLAQIYVASINSGAVPCIENAVQALAQIENAAALKEALARYTELMGQRAKLPTETLQQLLDLHTQCEGEALAVFTGRAFKDDEATFQNQLMRDLAARKEEFCRRNEEASVARCKAALVEASRELEGKISNGSYSVPGGYQRFLADQKEMEEKYRQEPGKGIKADEVLKEFLTSKEAVTGSILQTDKALTEKEKEMAAERARVVAAERQQRVLVQQNAEMQQKLEDEKRSIAEHIRRAEERHKNEMKALMEEHQRVLDHKRKEEALLRKEGKKEAELLKGQIDALQKENSKAKQQDAASIISAIMSGVTSIIGASGGAGARTPRC